MKNSKLPNWLKQTIKYGHPLVWDICFTLFQKGNFKMLDVILQNIPALIIITILGYIITFYFHKIDKIKKQYEKDRLIQKCDDKTRDIYLNLILKIIRTLSNDEEKYYKFYFESNAEIELKYIGYAGIQKENDNKTSFIHNPKMNKTTMNLLKENFSDAELKILGFTKEEIKFIRNEYNRNIGEVTD